MNTTEHARPTVVPRRRSRIASDVHRRVEHSLHTRAAARGTLAHKLESRFKREGLRAWSFVKRRPSVGIVVAGGVGFALASTLGVGEIVVALSAAYGAYEVLREDVPPAAAVRNSIGLLEGAK